MLLALSALLAGCGSRNPCFDASRAHHTPDGLKNNDIGAADKSFGQLMRWRWESLQDGLPRPPQTPPPQVAPDLAAMHANARLCAAAMQAAISWIGHASMLVQASGLNVLTDPAFSERASPLSFLGPRRTQPPVTWRRPWQSNPSRRRTFFC
jgi:N-acyl-phosphatidylethanolamine-hydrolysing phospholipase D